MSGFEDRLHPEAKAALKLFGTSSPELSGTTSFDGEVKDLRIPSPEVSEGIPVYVYQPTSILPDPPLLVYFHGGGLIGGDRAMVDTLCRKISQQAKCIIINVEYRLAPKHKFPAFLNDAKTAAKWTIDNKKELGGGSRSIVGVGGDSAGAVLAASVCHTVAPLDFQILAYGRVSPTTDLPAYKEFADGPGLSMALIEKIEKTICDNPADATGPEMRVLGRDKFDHVPSALFIVAELDPIRDDSYAHADKLRASGVYTDILLVKGVVHGFLPQCGIYKENCKLAYDKIVEFITKIYNEKQK